VRRLTLWLMVTCFAGCTTQRSAVTEKPLPEHPPRLENAQPSAWALAELVLLALEERDAVTLNSLRITEREYKEIIFPEFPQAQPGHNIPVDFPWFHLNLKSLSGLQDAVDSYGGEEYELLDVFPTQGIDQHRTFRILKKVELRVRRKADGKEAQIRVFGSVVDLGGQYKILSFPS